MIKTHQKSQSSVNGERLQMYKYDSLQDFQNENGFTESEKKVDDYHDKDTQCTIKACTRFSSPVAFLCFLVPMYAVIVATSTYFGGCISTIEKQFQLTSSQSGLLATVNDAVGLSVVVFVTFYGNKSHRPRIIGSSGIIVGIGFFLLAMPHFTTDPVSYTDNSYSLQANENDSNSRQVNNKELCSVDDVAQDRCSSGDVAEDAPASLFWLIVGQVLLGVGGSPLFPLTITYLDDSTVDSTTTSVYVAGLFMAMGLGPFLGFVMSFKCLSFYVDFERVDVIPISPTDPRWIGAWWLGFVIASIVIILFSIPLLFFPRKLNKYELTCCGGSSKEKPEEGAFSMADIYKNDIISHKKNGILANLRELLLAIKRLLLNPTLIILNLSISCELAVVGGFAFFMAKYVENQFGLTAATAAIIIGGINLPGNIIGNIMSSFFVKKFKLTLFGLGKMLLTVSICSFSFALPILFIGCSNPPIAGLTTPYNTSFSQGTLPNLNNTCNSNCACSNSVYQPVCGHDGVTYTSACRAGCVDVETWRDDMGDLKDIQINDTVYFGCSCIPSNVLPTDELFEEGGIATEGSCDWSCDKLVPFIFFIAAVSICSTLKTNPNMMLNLRCVDQKDRALAIACCGVLVRVLGFFPSPIYFGAAISSTCLLRQESCSRQGACLIYDLERYRYTFVGLFVGLKLLAAILSTCTYFSIDPDRLKRKSERNEMELSKINSKQ
ncbi:solute carrier organic anion transporter family member 2A1-like [Antedon mediterranea]|uniref:solute carrier organic anion transporter family member 2A1-like n=1 Tax=Antedon mediterranea TaxID=105859 RepID=UPI003AF6AA34